MAERNVQIKLLSSNISNRPLPTNLLLGEAVVNTADGIVMFSGSSQGANGYEQLVDPSIPNATGGTYFEVGSNLYNLKIRNKITQYNGLSDLSGKFLSGTSEGFVLADISDIVTASNGLTDDGNNIKLGGILTESTVISGGSQTLDLGTSDSQLSFFRVNSIQASEEYSVPGYILTTQQNPGGITSEVSTDTGMRAQYDLHPGNFVVQALGGSGNTYTNLYASSTYGGIISNDLINNSSSYFNINNNGSANLAVQGSGSTNSSGLDLDDTAGGMGLRFIDGRANGAGLEYGADYSTNFTNRSLVDKAYVDGEIAALDAADTFVTGGTFDNATGDITFTQNDGSTFTVDLSALDLNDTVVTGATEIDGVVYFDTNDSASAFTADLTSLITNGNGTTANGTSVDLGGILTESTVISGGSQTLELGTSDSQINQFRVNAIESIGEFTAPGAGVLNVNQNPGGFTSLFTDATTQSKIQNTSGDAYVQVYKDGGAQRTDFILSGAYAQLMIQSPDTNNQPSGFVMNANTGQTLQFVFADSRTTTKGLEYAADYSTGFTNNSLITKKYVDDAITGVSASDTFVTGGTFDNATGDITFTQNDGSTFAVDLSALDLNDTVVTGGTISYVDEAGTITFTNSDGSTFDVTGITDVQTTGGTFDNATGDITFTQNNGSTFTVDLSALDLNDTVVTGATEIDGIVYFDTNDSASAFTADLTSLITNGNGTTANGTSVDLGGNLTSDVFIDGLSGSSSMHLGSYGPDKQLSTFSVGANNGITLFNYENNIITSSLGLTDSGAAIASDVISGTTTVVGGNLQLIAGSGSGNTATVTTPGPGALKYAADYSANFTDRSLVDKAYVDGEIAALDAADTFVTGFTYDNANTLTISRNEGEADLTVNISTFTGVTISTLDANSIVYTDGSGKLTTEGTFSYDAGTDTMTVGNITVQNGSGSTATFGQGGVTIGSNGIGDLTVQGDLIVLGTTTTISTTELVVEDPTITVNYSTGTTNATSLGSGIEIQDGNGDDTDAYLKIEELNTAYPSEYTSLTGSENRALYTNLNDIVIRQATDISSPAANQVGKRVLAEDDILDSGSY
jgi:hypothetical protein